MTPEARLRISAEPPEVEGASVEELRASIEALREWGGEWREQALEFEAQLARSKDLNCDHQHCY